ncbi:hypothetical protein D3C79_1022010 [compost metagenome]
MEPGRAHADNQGGHEAQRLIHRQRHKRTVQPKLDGQRTGDHQRNEAAKDIGQHIAGHILLAVEHAKQ